MGQKLDKKDLAILTLIQGDAKLTAREIAKKINAPITTVFSKIRRMEQLGVIKGYRAILDSRKLDRGIGAFILVSVSYGIEGSQIDVAADIARFPEAQEVQIITGDWDILIKLKVRDVDSIGRFVIDRLRQVKGIQKTLTSVIIDTCKETTEIPLTTEPSQSQTFEDRTN